MANLCKSCKWYNKSVDDLTIAFDDTNTEKQIRHGCVMYQDYIPQKIWYENGDCPYYFKREEDDGTGRRS